MVFITSTSSLFNGIAISSGGDCTGYCISVLAIGCLFSGLIFYFNSNFYFLISLNGFFVLSHHFSWIFQIYLTYLLLMEYLTCQFLLFYFLLLLSYS